VQLHYNLADDATLGRSDSTTIHLRFADTVNRRLDFLVAGILSRIDRSQGQRRPAAPDTLPPGQADAPYTWTRMARDVGIDGVASVDLVAACRTCMDAGSGSRCTSVPAAAPACAAHLENWKLSLARSSISTRPHRHHPGLPDPGDLRVQHLGRHHAVLPGWGTRNEMCLAVMNGRAATGVMSRALTA